jgi:hypothetical protein
LCRVSSLVYMEHVHSIIRFFTLAWCLLFCAGCLDLNSSNYNFDGGVASTPECASRCQTPASTCRDNKTLLANKLTNCDEKKCQYSNVLVTCANECINGACVGQPCAGVFCENPAQSECTGEHTLSVNVAPGICSETTGQCIFQVAQMSCQGTCSTGRCESDLCLGVSCRIPPLSQCVGNNARNFVAGACRNGTCEFSNVDTPCVNGCFNGACITNASGGGSAVSGGGTAIAGGGSGLFGGGASAGGSASTGGGTVFASGGGTSSFGGGGAGGGAAIALWTQVNAAPPLPTFRSEAALAYDSVRQKVIMFGGGNSNRRLNDTWEWNGSNWTEIIIAGNRPSIRDGAAMAYDAHRNVTVLFGGDADNDTWEYNGVAWFPITTVSVPPVRDNHTMVYDSVRHRMVMFGGAAFIAGTTSYLQDTWEYDGTNWFNVTPAGTKPPGRTEHVMYYDVANQRTVLAFGSNGSTLMTDLWAWNGTAWTPLPVPTNKPAGRDEASIAYDSVRQRAVLFGGDRNGVRLQDTWEFDGTNWTQVATTSLGPSARYRFSLVFDMAHNKVLLFGGYDATRANNQDTWLFGP